MDLKLELLIQIWNLREDFINKSPIADMSAGESDPDEVPPFEIVGLFPECLVDFLLDSEFELEYRNGAPGNGYDARENRAVVKKANDMLREIGHAMWYEKIPPEKYSYEKIAVINSSRSDGTQRKRLEPHQIPPLHKLYGDLVGAYSAQFLLESHPDPRMNDLEEHFARNFDYLLKGKPLEVLTTKNATLHRFMEFYKNVLVVIDDHFEQFYRLSIQKDHSGRWCRQVKVDDIKDGDPITPDLIRRVKELKERVR
jgi:hypothetical protein